MQYSLDDDEEDEGDSDMSLHSNDGIDEANDGPVQASFLDRTDEPGQLCGVA